MLEDECFIWEEMTGFGSGQCQFKVSLVMNCLAACSSSMKRRSCVLQWGSNSNEARKKDGVV